MKRKIVSTLLCAAMVISTMAGCGSSASTDAGTSDSGNSTTAKESTASTEADTTDEATASSGDEGKVLNIYCWNEEFKSLFSNAIGTLSLSNFPYKSESIINS